MSSSEGKAAVLRAASMGALGQKSLAASKASMVVKNAVSEGLGQTVAAALWRWLQIERLKTFFISQRVPISDTATVVKKNLYIAPSGAGAMLGVTLLLMLIASINYESNLGHAVTFMLVGVSSASMFATFFNLRGLKLSLGATKDVEAGSVCEVAIVLSSDKKSDSFELELAWRTDGQAGRFLSPVNVPAGKTTVVHLGIEAKARGWMTLPMVCVQSKFPLGVYCAWSYLRPQSRVLVYPKPEANPPAFVRQSQHDDGQEGFASAVVSDEFDGVKPYRRGDSLKSVVWKQAAKAFARGSSDLVVRDQLMGRKSSLWFDIDHTGLAQSQSDEMKLSRLCAWVKASSLAGTPYGLRLRQVVIEPSTGTAHLAKCLRAMALY